MKINVKQKKQCHLLSLMIWKVKEQILKVSQCQLFLVDFCGFSSIWQTKFSTIQGVGIFNFRVHFCH